MNHLTYSLVGKSAMEFCKKRSVLLFMGLLCAFCISCDDQQAGTLDPPLGTSEDLIMSSSTQDIIVAESEEEMVESVLAELLEIVDGEPDELIILARIKVKAMLAERFRLSEYEIPFIPEEKNPEFQYMTYCTQDGIWYFAIPNNLCGTAIPEEKYGMRPGDITFMCGGD